MSTTAHLRRPLRGHSVPAFLASVTTAAEAALAIAGGADVIDAKNPAEGALGALPLATVRAILAEVSGTRLVSATIGDLPACATAMVPAAEAMAATGVDIVKVGFFGSDRSDAVIAALGRTDIGQAKLIAVLMADQPFDETIVERLAVAGFVGVMLDTADKAAGSLTNVRSVTELAAFLHMARGFGLVGGLAGSLRACDVTPLAALCPDVLGFRGALCANGRQSVLDAARVAAIRHAISAAVSDREAVRVARG